MEAIRAVVSFETACDINALGWEPRHDCECVSATGNVDITKVYV